MSDNYLYEVMARFTADGFQGAHAKDMECLRLADGTLQDFRVGDPRPVTEKEFGKLLGKETAKLIQAADAARGETEQALRKVEDQRSRAQAAEQEALHFKGQAGNAQADLTSLQQRLAYFAKDEAMVATLKKVGIKIEPPEGDSAMPHPHNDKNPPEKPKPDPEPITQDDPESPPPSPPPGPPSNPGPLGP